MTVAIDRLVWEPGVCLFAAKTIIPSAFDNAIEMMGLSDVAEDQDTPLANLRARVNLRPHGGQGDDIAEFAGRFCYRSWKKGRSHEEYIANVLQERHGSVFAHGDVSLVITGVSRSLTHELIRHHVGTNISQESQRYVAADEINFVVPPLMANEVMRLTGGNMPTDDLLDSMPFMKHWRRACQTALYSYVELKPELEALAQEAEERAGAGDIKAATSAKKRALEAARSVLPNGVETRGVWSVNLRALLNILHSRGSEYADLEIRRLAIALAYEVAPYAPEFFKGVQIITARDRLASIQTNPDHI